MTDSSLTCGMKIVQRDVCCDPEHGKPTLINRVNIQIQTHEMNDKVEEMNVKVESGRNSIIK